MQSQKKIAGKFVKEYLKQKVEPGFLKKCLEFKNGHFPMSGMSISKLFCNVFEPFQRLVAVNTNRNF